MLETINYLVWGIAVTLSFIGFIRSFQNKRENDKVSETPGMVQKITEGLKQNAKKLGLFLIAFVIANVAFYFAVDIAEKNGYVGQNPGLDSLYIVATILVGCQVIMLTTEKLLNNQNLYCFFRRFSIIAFFMAYLAYMLWLENQMI